MHGDPLGVVDEQREIAAALREQIEHRLELRHDGEARKDLRAPAFVEPLELLSLRAHAEGVESGVLPGDLGRDRLRPLAGERAIEGHDLHGRIGDVGAVRQRWMLWHRPDDAGRASSSATGHVRRGAPRSVPRARCRAGPRALPGSGASDPRALRGQQRHPGHAYREREIARRPGLSLLRDEPGPAQLLLGAHQGARQREVLRAVPRVRRRPRGPRDGRRHGQPRRANRLLHRRDPVEHRPSRGQGGGGRLRGHRRVSLLRGQRARGRVAGPAARPRTRAVPPDERDARADRDVREGADEAHAARDGHGPVRRPSGAARLRVPRDAAARDDSGAPADWAAPPSTSSTSPSAAPRRPRRT